MSETVRIALPKSRDLPALLKHFEQCEFTIDPSVESPQVIAQPFASGFDFEFVVLSPSDVCTYVERGVCHAGIVGTEVLRETGVQVWRPFTFNFGSYPLILAAPQGQSLARLSERPVLRLATPYSRFVRDWFATRGMSVEVIQVEDNAGTAVQLHLADAFVDRLTDPHVLLQEDFRAVEVLDHTRLKLVVNNALGSKRRREIGRWIERLDETRPPDPVPITIPFDLDDPI